MDQLPNPPDAPSAIGRQDFIASLARRGMIAGLFGVGAAALHGQRAVSECFNDNHCAVCWAYSGCGLPEKKELEQ